MSLAPAVCASRHALALSARCFDTDIACPSCGALADYYCAPVVAGTDIVPMNRLFAAIVFSAAGDSYDERLNPSTVVAVRPFATAYPWLPPASIGERSRPRRGGQLTFDGLTLQRTLIDYVQRAHGPGLRFAVGPRAIGGNTGPRSRPVFVYDSGGRLVAALAPLRRRRALVSIQGATKIAKRRGRP